MKTLKIQLFNFDELSKESKKEAITNYIKENREHIQQFQSDCFYLDCKEFVINEIENCFNVNEVQYSLSYCQGDGFSFTFELDIKKYINKYFDYLKDSQKSVLIDYGVFSSSFSVNRYCYASKNDIDFCLDYCSGNELNNINELFRKVLTHLENRYIEICNELEIKGYNTIYEWESDTQFIIEEIYNSEESEPIFLKDGSIY